MEPCDWRHPIPRRSAGALPFDADAVLRGRRIVLDTTVYIDELQGRLPESIQDLLSRCIILHCAVARAELALSLGHLDPADPRTPRRRAVLGAMLDRMRPERRIAPSERAWTEAAVLAGILARTQGLDRSERRAILNDCLMLMAAREAGAVLVSRNIADLDRLTLLRPDARVLLYNISS